jgi:tetratricopeptide (TPR) repeat protein
MILTELYDYGAAIEIFNILLDSDEFSRDACAELAYCFLSLEDFETAKIYFERAIDYDPYDYYCWYNYGMMLSQGAKFYRAIRCFDFALSIKNDFTPALYEKGKALSALGKVKQAIESFKLSHLSSPKDIDILLDLAHTYLELDEFGLAFFYFNKAIKVDSKDYEPYLGRGAAYQAIFEHEKALLDFNSALERDPFNPSIWHAKANLLTAQGRHQEANDCFYYVLKYEPTSAENWFDYAMSFHNIDQHKKAIYCLHSALKIEPCHANAYNWLYLFYSLIDETDLAHKYLRLAYLLEPRKFADLLKQSEDKAK